MGIGKASCAVNSRINIETACTLLVGLHVHAVTVPEPHTA